MATRGPAFDRTVARRLILTAMTARGVNQWANLYDEVQRIAIAEGVVARSFNLRDHTFSADLGLVNEVGWELVLEGVIRPSDPGGQHMFLTLTEYGAKVVHSSDPNPHDPDGYLAALRKRVPAVDDVTLLYVNEAIACHRSRNYIAAILMVGVAVEHALVDLSEATATWLPPTEAANLRKVLDGQRKAAHLYDELRKRLDGKKSALPTDFAQHYEVSLLGMGTAIRLARNDAGHPTGQRFDRDDSAQFLMMLPRYLEHAVGLAAWMRAQSGGSP